MSTEHAPEPGPGVSGSALDSIAEEYIAAGETEYARKGRRSGVAGFIARFGDLHGWNTSPVALRRGQRSEITSFATFAAIRTGLAVDAQFVVTARCQWGRLLREHFPDQHQRFSTQSGELGFTPPATSRMWLHLARIAAIAGTTPDALDTDSYSRCRHLYSGLMHAGAEDWDLNKAVSTPLFGLDAVMYHRGQGPLPEKKRRWIHRPIAEVDWDRITDAAPVLAATMRRYLQQSALSLRPSSVVLFNTTLRQFAGYLIDHHDPGADVPAAATVADVTRDHVEGYKSWLAARPGYRGKSLSKTTLGMRMGHLRTFFTRIIEWDYDDAPTRVPVYRTERPRLDKPLPKFLDDADAAAFMAAARQLPDKLDRLIVQLLARTGMRRGELLGLTIDAVVQIGTGYWLRTPVGKLHNDRYIPLDPRIKTLIDEWLNGRANWQLTDTLLVARGRPLAPTRVDRAVAKAATAAGIGHVHPHQLRHTLATQAINRGMSLQAIAALLGHHDLSMTMVYARIGDRTVADQYFKVTKKIEFLYSRPERSPIELPADTANPAMKALHNEASKRLLGNGYCSRPIELDCRYETICESCTMFFATLEHRDTIAAHYRDACAKGQTRRAEVYATLLDTLKSDTA